TTRRPSRRRHFMRRPWARREACTLAAPPTLAAALSLAARRISAAEACTSAARRVADPDGHSQANAGGSPPPAPSPVMARLARINPKRTSSDYARCHRNAFKIRVLSVPTGTRGAWMAGTSPAMTKPRREHPDKPRFSLLLTENREKPTACDALSSQKHLLLQHVAWEIARAGTDPLTGRIIRHNREIICRNREITGGERGNRLDRRWCNSTRVQLLNAED